MWNNQMRTWASRKSIMEELKEKLFVIHGELETAGKDSL